MIQNNSTSKSATSQSLCQTGDIFMSKYEKELAKIMKWVLSKKKEEQLNQVLVTDQLTSSNSWELKNNSQPIGRDKSVKTKTF